MNMDMDKIKFILITAVTLMLSSCADVPTEPPTEDISETEQTTVYTSETPDVTEREPSPEDGYRYEIKDDEAHITRCLIKEKDIVVPDTLEGCPVTRVNGFYEDCTESITLPASVKELSASDLSGAENLRAVYINGNCPDYKSVDGVIYTADGRNLILFPRGRTGSFTVPEGVAGIGEYAFRFSRLDIIKLPESLERIGYYAFDTARITELYLPDGVTSAASIAGFYSDMKISAYTPCAGLESLEIYGNLEYRSETALQKALRTGRKMTDGHDTSERTFKGVFSDIDGDGFPELALFGGYSKSLYKYSETDGWLPYLGDIFPDNGTPVYIYYDSENDSYFCLRFFLSETSDYFIGAEKVMRDKNGELTTVPLGGSGIIMPFGSYVNNDGNAIFFLCRGSSEIFVRDGNEPSYDSCSINDFTGGFIKFTRNSLSEYEFIKSINISEICDELAEKAGIDHSGEKYFYDGENFADSPTAKFITDRYDMTAPAREPLFTIGDTPYYADSYSAWLTGEEINAENFEKLSLLPSLSFLNIYARDRDTADISGIEKLTGLRELSITADKIIGAESLSGLTHLQSLYLAAMDDISFISGLDSVEILEISSAANRPDDYFSPAYGMESIKYIPVSDWDGTDMSYGQEEHIKENRPDIKLCHYKIG